MKKTTLSTIVILSFIIYALTQKPQSPAAIALNSPPPTSTPPPTLVSSVIPPQRPTSRPTPAGQYRDGQYTGSNADAVYGNLQVRAVITGGRLSDVQFLDYPQDRSHSLEVSNYSIPILTQEAVQSQKAQVDLVSGATDTSLAFIQSLQSALNQAKN